MIGTQSDRKVVFWWFHSALCIWGRRKFYHRVHRAHRVWVYVLHTRIPLCVLCGDENIPSLRNAADPRNALVFPFSHSSKPLCAFATSRDAFFVLFVVVAIMWNLARRAAMSRKNGGVTFPRQAAKRAKANRERNGSVGQRWKL